MKLVLFITTIALFTSCSVLNKAKVHQRMSNDLDKYTYNYSLKELFNKVDASLKDNSITDGKFIMVSADPRMPKPDTQDKNREKLEEGFTFNNKFYMTSNDIGFNLLNLDFSGAKDKIFTSKYHVIKNDRKEFIIVDSDKIIKGKYISKDKSSLKVEIITRVIQPVELSLDWLSLVKGKGLKILSNKSPVDLEKTLNYTIPDKASELSYYFKFNKEEANKKEADLLKQL